MITPERIIVLASAIVAVLLQVLLAPHIGLFSAIPNFIAVVTMVIALARANSFGPVMPFIMGLAYDLLSGGPLGAMAFSLTAFSVLAARYFERADNDTVFMGLVTLAVGLLLVELSFGIFLLLFGYATNLFDAFVYRIAPCFLYNVVIAFILYPIAVRFLKPGDPMQPQIAHL